MQGRFKRDGSASAEPEPHNGTGNGSSPQHAQNPGPAEIGDGGERSGRPGASVAPQASGKSKGGTNGGATSGSRIALRNWRISTRLVSLLALPVVAATSLGALRIGDNVDDIQQLDNMRLLTDMTKQATELATALQQERDLSAGPLAHGLNANDYTVKGAREKTDQARVQFTDATQAAETANTTEKMPGVRDSLVRVVRELYNLSTIRKNAYVDPKNSTQTVEAYHRLVDQLLDLSTDMAEATSNPDMIKRTRALAAFSSAKEYASVQRAVIAAALPETDDKAGKLSENDRLYANAALANEESDRSTFSDIYGSGAEELTRPIDDASPTIEASDVYADRVLASAGGLGGQDKRSYKDWTDDSAAKIEQMKKIEGSLLEEMEQTARNLRADAEQEAIISGALILLVLGVSLVGAFVVARSMIRSLRRLQDTATKVAQDRLPELVKQLSESDPQDVDTSVESVGVHSRDEIGQVAAAFDDVHREAVRLAAEQALLRGNVNAMFTNLSRRSQGLIQRQLSLISELESREADPDQLSSLFKLDHLATRMRRNGENLLVLAGEEPGRRWTRPVPLVDVLRAAASEVEQYERIELSSVPTTEVAGRVVNDLVHLLAELLENATSFSSPQTKVKVTGHALPDGRVLIEIHDTGIGLSPEDLAAINERLASPPTVDVSVSRRMGLFVVGRLSQRHGIRIQLRPSDSGGTTALVMLPVDVAQGNKKPTPGKPGQGAPSTGGPAAAQAAAGAAAARRQAGNQSGPPLGGPSAGGGLLGGAPQRGQVGAGQGPRAALPGNPSGPGGLGNPGGPRGPQGGPPVPPQGGRPPAGAGAGGFGGGGAFGGGQAPGAPQGLQAAGTGGANGFESFDDSGRQGGFPTGSGLRPAGGPGDTGASRPGPADGGPGAVPPKQGKERSGRRRPQLPGRGGPRAELPGGNAPSRTPSWSDDNAQPPVPRASLDAPRGHEEQPDVTAPMPRVDPGQAPGSPADFPHNPGADFDSRRPGAGTPAQDGTGSYIRSDVYGGAGAPPAPTGPSRGASHDPSSTGQFAVTGYDGSGTGQFPAPGRQNPQGTGQFGAPGRPGPQDPAQFGAPGRQNGQGPGRYDAPGRQNSQDTGQFERPQVNGEGFNAPRPPVPPQRPPVPPQRPARPQEPEALPPATGPMDGRTPLYDTLETNWFHGQGGQNGQNGQQQGQQSNGSAPQQPAAPAPQTPAAPQRPASPAAPASTSWRSTPNDDLVRQAERARQPSAGGVTTSGLPRRVPRANLVPGTAQQQQHQTGPQVSRSPDDVRGRLTNLRRGIAQGRQAGNGQTGSFPSPTHQQER
ncbi:MULTISPECIES: sensor histidine kinase [Streptomyces]|uniref:histidine kinase n=1 Tax=Streptomyces stelliscabiei TaxID=146820 RepID=A0A8I0PAC0_9ACTN|nr:MULTISPECIES: nitrate- and nitrite sensing domain-containing protein [Streptomyces]KND42361.1 membrane protein [Streptomyces stelliscabiei]MBE1600492.1 signal transduction histidine kinase [Streptomyces stelliscabiei]MDX2518307.1 nitrate- and nitrite sensing domain-containing protein [Streptomyces stelliscabiei]SOD69773.1 Signal transduction histidine kinase [Streptomyces sp. 1222.2]